MSNLQILIFFDFGATSSGSQEVFRSRISPIKCHEKYIWKSLDAVYGVWSVEFREPLMMTPKFSGVELKKPLKLDFVVSVLEGIGDVF